MPIPEGYLPRKGDVVVLHAVVKYDVNPTEDADGEEGLQVWVTPKEYHSSSRVPLKTLVGLYSRHFDEGDRVRPIGQPTAVGTVLANCDDRVWVKFDATPTVPEHFETYRSENLEPIPDPVDAPAPPPGPMRFSVGETVTLARLPEDPSRSEEIAPYVGHPVTIRGIEGALYRVRVVNGSDFFASDDMLEAVPF